MELRKLTKEIARATSIAILKEYDEDEVSDAGFEWVDKGISYHVQIAMYETKPYLIHMTIDDGCIKQVDACHDVTELITSIRELVNK